MDPQIFRLDITPDDKGGRPLASRFKFSLSAFRVCTNGKLAERPVHPTTGCRGHSSGLSGSAATNLLSPRTPRQRFGKGDLSLPKEATPALNQDKT